MLTIADDFCYVATTPLRNTDRLPLWRVLWRVSEEYTLILCVYIYIYIHIYTCICVCVYIHIYIYIYIYRERERYMLTTMRTLI